jgi:hypothetical protein
LHAAVLVLDPRRLRHAARAALERMAIGVLGVRDPDRDVLDAVAVQALVARDLVVAAKRAREDEADVPLLDDVGRAVADARLGARVRGLAKAEAALVEVRRLLRVAHPELEVVPVDKRHEVLLHR